MLSPGMVDELSVLLSDVTAPRGNNKRQRWPSCSIKESVIGEYLIVPLTSGGMVKSEGFRMSNCCREYIPLCAQGKYALYSIRTRSGERVATLGLVNDDDHWRLDQCYGYSNGEVLEECLEFIDEEGVVHSECYPTELYYVVHEVVRLMNVARTH